MKRILLTGMSGTGKSSLVREFASLGYRAVDTDAGGWSVPPHGGARSGPVQPDWIWDEQKIQQLLSSERGDVLFVAGCVENQGAFYSSFDEIILLTAPPETIIERLATRTSKPFGKSAAERAKVLDDQRQFEPVLRGGATIVIDTNPPLDQVVLAILDRVGCCSAADA
ncbi:MAG: AAA family ATPase [Acidimicrobiia bacterium]|nr:AAA family ATPase [Acidimicrobiia bacterium]